VEREVYESKSHDDMGLNINEDLCNILWMEHLRTVSDNFNADSNRRELKGPLKYVWEKIIPYSVSRHIIVKWSPDIAAIISMTILQHHCETGSYER